MINNTTEENDFSQNYDSSAHDADDGASRSGESGNSSTQSGNGTTNVSSSAPVLAQKENKRVTQSKALVAFVLFIATAVVATMTYRYTDNEEEKDFETRFNDFANQIISVYQINALNIIDAYVSFAFHLTTYAIGTGSKWPFVTVPGYAQEAGYTMHTTGANTISVSPIVTPENKEEWGNYSVANQGWVQDAYDYGEANEMARPIVPFIWGDIRSMMNPQPLEEPRNDVYVPLWQTAVLNFRNLGLANFDVLRFGTYPTYFEKMLKSRKPTLSYANNLDRLEGSTPESFMIVPIFETVDIDDAPIVGSITSLLPWSNYFDNLVPEGIDGIYLVVRNSCEEAFTYEINGPVVNFLGLGDWHDMKYDSYEVTTDFTTFTEVTECLNTLHIYPSDTFHEAYVSNKPIYYTLATVFIFFLTALVFIIYDCLVEKRQDKVMTTATRSTAIVSSLFPENVRDRLMDGSDQKQESKQANGLESRLPFGGADKSVWKTDAATPLQEAPLSTKPIADLFPDATVLFADIVGFTAWSSVREPTQVFTLLEGIYNSFDRIARKRRVFKVETIGDCYVATTGLPEKMADHAVVMARFARDCLKKMTEVTQRLETTLGPDTAELGIRVGLHSGPVTAGVLRGEKSRFQLFGDTVNTAARMESTGAKNRIQLSQETAELISSASCKDMWIKPRDTLTDVKGKGQLQTYWLEYKSVGTASVASSIFTSSLLQHPGSREQELSQMHYSPEDIATAKSEKVDRLIEWNVEILTHSLKKIVGMRGVTPPVVKVTKGLNNVKFGTNGETVLDEVQEVITLPSQAAKYKTDPEAVTLDPLVTTQLKTFVSTIASMYRNENRFHGFEHASHVTQSVTKLLSRVVTSDTIDYGDLQYKQKAESNALHKYTFGITSDPITQFAVAFSALIHDVDHPGVPNAQLVKEQTDEAIQYKNKSIAEQKSVDIAWDLMMEPAYEALRACIYTTQSELHHFRQVVVNTVMATDIVDKELGALRKKRWGIAFPNHKGPEGDNDDGSNATSSTDSSASSSSSTSSVVDANRKATIVIEHLIQASDVAHTMQHWHVYLKWNERFFHECHQAYLDGRADKNPMDGWYEGELGFFDFYIIPLAKKLKECGVFGVSSDEYLTYAEANRKEWALKGKDLVQGYLRTYHEVQAMTNMGKDV